MRHLPSLFAICFALTLSARGQDSPFGATVAVTNSTDGKPLIAVRLTVPPGHYLYAEHVSVEGEEGVVAIGGHRATRLLYGLMGAIRNRQDSSRECVESLSSRRRTAAG